MLVNKARLNVGALLVSLASATVWIAGDLAFSAAGPDSVVAEGAASANVSLFGGEVPGGLMTLGSDVATVCSVFATAARVSVA